MRILPKIERKQDGQAVAFVTHQENERFVPKQLVNSPSIKNRFSNTPDRTKTLADLSQLRLHFVSLASDNYDKSYSIK